MFIMIINSKGASPHRTKGPMTMASPRTRMRVDPLTHAWNGKHYMPTLAHDYVRCWPIVSEIFNFARCGLIMKETIQSGVKATQRMPITTPALPCRCRKHAMHVRNYTRHEISPIGLHLDVLYTWRCMIYV